MKKRALPLLLALCVLLLIPHAASANAPVPDPLQIKVKCKNVEPGTVLVAMFAGEDGVFHPDEFIGPGVVTETRTTFGFRRGESDTQMYLEVTHPDGAVAQSNTMPVKGDDEFSYDGKTNVLSVRTRTVATSCLGDIFLFLLTIVAELLAAFALTVLVEFLLGLCFRMKPIRYVIIANLITNIPMNIVLMILSGFAGSVGYWIALIVLEIIVCVVEYLIYRIKYQDRKRWYVLLFAVVANAASLAAGLLLLNLLF